MLERFITPLSILSDESVVKKVENYFSDKEGKKMIEQSLSQVLERIKINSSFVKKNN